MGVSPITLVAATAVVRVLASDRWQQARSALVRLWRNENQEQQSAVSREIVATRKQALAAREANDDAAEERLAAQWHRQFSGLIDRSPEASAELEAALEQDIRPLLTDPDQDQVFVTQQQIRAGRDAYVTGAGNVNIFQGQTINER
jgi:hypothetical protein